MDPLTQLQDIQLAEPVGLWPLAWGWWLLLAIVLLLCALAVVGGLRYWRKRAAKRQALVLLRQLAPAQPNWQSQLNQIIKRLALSYYPASNSQSLYGDNWVSFLKKQLPAKQQAAFSEQFCALQHSLYQANNSPLNFADCKQQAERWIKAATPPSGKQQRSAAHV